MFAMGQKRTRVFDAEVRIRVRSLWFADRDARRCLEHAILLLTTGSDLVACSRLDPIVVRVTQGSSGAPLVMMKDGSAVIMGLQIAVGRRNGADIMLAVAAPSIMDNLLHR
jgi:hypothetical protein